MDLAKSGLKQMSEAQLKSIRMREYYNRRVKADFAPKKVGDSTLEDSIEAESPSPTLNGDDSPLSPEELEQRALEK